jgi:hypothetical protein
MSSMLNHTFYAANRGFEALGCLKSSLDPNQLDTSESPRLEHTTRRPSYWHQGRSSISEGTWSDTWGREVYGTGSVSQEINTYKYWNLLNGIRPALILDKSYVPELRKMVGESFLSQLTSFDQSHTG